MDFQLTEMQQMLVDTARRFVAAETGLDQWRARREIADGVDPRLWSAMAEMGWLALAVPEDAGGLGGSMEDVALLMMELGQGMVTEPLVSSGILAVHVLDCTLTGSARIDWLGQLAAGAARIALAHADSQAEGFAPLTAVAKAAGYVLQGHKVMAFDAPSADHCIALAQLDGSPALFLVPAKSDGISMTSYPLVDGSRASDLHFAEVAVPADALLAQGDAALAVLDAALDRARVALVAQAVGAMEATVRISAAYAGERQQFGQPIGSFQAIQHIAADMFVASYQARSALYAALRDIAAAAPVRRRTTSVAKLIAGLSGQTVSRNGIQIHGGYGVTDEFAVSHYYRRLLVLEKQYGGIHDHTALLAAIEKSL
jgi:alkylation response protein AidB-like acyl-CoA dehydrogenase